MLPNISPGSATLHPGLPIFCPYRAGVSQILILCTSPLCESRKLSGRRKEIKGISYKQRSHESHHSPSIHWRVNRSEQKSNKMESPIGTTQKQIPNTTASNLSSTPNKSLCSAVDRCYPIYPRFRFAAPGAIDVLPLQGRCQPNIDFIISPSMRTK